MGMPVAVVKKDELKLIQEEEERSMGSKLALKWAIQPRSSKLYWCASSDRPLEYICILRYFRLAFVNGMVEWNEARAVCKSWTIQYLEVLVLAD
jgi:hypothetical protein